MSRKTNQAKAMAKNDLVLDAPLLYLNAIRNGLMEDESRGRQDALKLMRWAVDHEVIDWDGTPSMADAIDWVSQVAVEMDDEEGETGQMLTRLIRRRAIDLALDGGLITADKCDACGEVHVVPTSRGLLVAAEIAEMARMAWPEDDDTVLEALDEVHGAMGAEGTRMGAMSVDMHSFTHYRTRAEEIGRAEEPRRDAVAHGIASAASLGARDPLRAGLNVHFGVYSTEEVMGAAQGYMDLIADGGFAIRQETPDKGLQKPADLYQAVDQLRQIGECIANMDPEHPVLDDTPVADAVQWQTIAYVRRHRLIHVRENRAEFSRIAVAVASLICQMTATAMHLVPEDEWMIPGVAPEVVVEDLMAGTQALWNLQAGLISRMIERPDGDDTEEDENVAAGAFLLAEAKKDGSLADIAAQANDVVRAMAQDFEERGLLG